MAGDLAALPTKRVLDHPAIIALLSAGPMAFACTEAEAVAISSWAWTNLGKARVSREAILGDDGEPKGYVLTLRLEPPKPRKAPKAPRKARADRGARRNGAPALQETL